MFYQDRLLKSLLIFDVLLDAFLALRRINIQAAAVKLGQ